MKFSALLALIAAPAVSGYAFVSSSSRNTLQSQTSVSSAVVSKRSTSTTLKMFEQNQLMGAGIAIAGTLAGIALVAFTEQAGEKGSGVSESMATNIAGSLMEDVEVSSVGDLGSLTSQLENALKSSGGVDDKKMNELDLTEEEKKQIAEDLDDGW
jgi:hypothetical protein